MHVNQVSLIMEPTSKVCSLAVKVKKLLQLQSRLRKVQTHVSSEAMKKLKEEHWMQNLSVEDMQEAERAIICFEQICHMLSRLGQRFWLPHANSLARKIIKNCVFWRCMQARPGEQKMADLPEDRLYPDLPPFSHVGIDYFGPIEVKRGRAQVKRWGGSSSPVW